MSIVYLIALTAVFGMILAAMAEAVAAVARKPVWQAARVPSLQLVETVDRRTQSLPFVGAERRLAEGGAELEAAADTAQPLRKAG